MAQRLSSTDFRKKKEIEEARKAGELPPEQDEDGNLINPHIPEFMSKAPWYLGEEAQKPGLKHQKKFKEEHTKVFDGLHATFKRGQKGFKAKTFRKGACKNCGAMTHKATECVERPRKIGAWKSGKAIAADEVLPNQLNLTYDGKRDRYNGYDADMYKRTVERFDLTEAERRKMKEEEREKRYEALTGASGAAAGEGSGKAVKRSRDEAASDSDSDADSDDSSDDDGVRQRESEAGVQQEVKRVTTKSKMTVRNLRIREDTAKYLLNLDVDSAYYDPKTRSMRENPLPMSDPKSANFAGENFTRFTGDALDVTQAQVFAWETYNQGDEEAHLQANPTAVEVHRRKMKGKKQAQDASKKKAVLDKYGGAEHTNKLPKELLLGQTEQFVEYGRDGRLLQGAAKAVPKSKYEEDVLDNNHSAVWGSYFDCETANWGYACCHQTMRNGYCTGAAGKRAAATKLTRAAPIEDRPMLAKAEPGSKEEEDIEKAKASLEPSTVKASRVWGENVTPDIDPEKLKKALQKAKRKRKEEKRRGDDRSRRYNSVTADVDVTEEDMEAYRMTRVRKDDPMAAFMQSSDDD